MKFGKFLAEKQQKYPQEWAENCIDYLMLKQFIKTEILPSSMHFELPSIGSSHAAVNGTTDSIVKDTGFAQMVQDRLSKLQSSVSEFIRRMDKEMEKFTRFYLTETARLDKEYATMKMNLVSVNVDGAQNEVDDHEDHFKTQRQYEQLLKQVVRFERYIFLNYTGITKILKKHDRHSGLKIGEPYLFTLTSLPFYRSEALTNLKRLLMSKVAGTPPMVSPANSSDALPLITVPQTTIQRPKGTWFPPAALLPHQKVLVSLSGPHGTDIIGAVLLCAAKYQCEIEDFTLSRLYHNVTFGCLITLNESNVDIFRDLAEQARKWDGTLFFDVHDKKEHLPSSIEDAPYEDRVKYAATVVNQYGLTATFLYDWTRLLLDLKISVEKMMRLNAGKVACADFKLSIPKDVDIDAFRAQVFELSKKHSTDVALQPYDVFRKNKRLVVFDMDSTLIQQEVIDEIAKHAGVVAEVAKITESAMNGEIDFKESLRRRVSLLKGTNVQILEKIKSDLIFTEGAHFLCKALKKLGYKLAVISGGFIPLALHVKHTLGLDYAFANQLKVANDGVTLTGETVGPIIDGMRKAELLEVIAQAESVTPEQVVAVGDGANDLWMLAAAGLGIAFNAKPRVQEKARARINQKSLKNILYLLGYTDDDAKQLAEM